MNESYILVVVVKDSLSYSPICPNVSTEAVPPPRQTQDNCALPLKVITYLLCYIQIVIYYITRTLY